jgi:hypothetical protein
VEIQLDGDDAKKASERAKVAAEQRFVSRLDFTLSRAQAQIPPSLLSSQLFLTRTQNVIPSWHLFSTVSGQQTALGITHAAQVARAAGTSYADENDEVQVVDDKSAEGQ